MKNTNVIEEVLNLEAVINKIDSATRKEQTRDYPLNQAVSAIYDALNLLKERAGLTDDGRRDVA